MPQSPKPLRPFVDAPEFADPDAYAALLAAPLPAMPLLIALDVGRERPDVVATHTALTRDEERDLFLGYNAARREHMATHDARWKVRADHFREYLVRTNLPLVGYAYGRFRTLAKNLDRDALASEGMAALLRAVEGFDVRRGFKFSTYAVHALFNSIRQVGQRNTRNRERMPLSSVADLGADVAASSVLDPADAMCERENREQLRAALTSDVAGLSETERRVLDGRFFGDETLEDIGAILGVSKERVRQVQIAALAKLRHYLTTGKSVVPPTRGPQPQAATLRENRQRLRAAIATNAADLSPPELRVIEGCFSGEEEEPLADVAEALGIFEQTVRRIRARAIARLEHYLNTGRPPARRGRPLRAAA